MPRTSFWMLTRIRRLALTVAEHSPPVLLDSDAAVGGASISGESQSPRLLMFGFKEVVPRLVEL